MGVLILRTRGHRAWPALLVAGALLLVGPRTMAQEAPPADSSELRFLRGDANADGVVDITDPLRTLVELFGVGSAPACEDAVDSNDDGAVNVTDPVFVLGYLFAKGVPIPPPGPLVCGNDPTSDDLTCLDYAAPDCRQVPPDSRVLRTGHLLNRIAYGPTQRDLDRVNTLGIEGYIEAQLNPEMIDESGNTELNQRVDRLFSEFQPSKDIDLVPFGSLWRFRRGTSSPPTNWNQPEYDDLQWERGPGGFGYGDNDDTTILADMKDNYLSVFLRTEFEATEDDVDRLILKVNYDDGFVAYLNGREIARKNLSGSRPSYNQAANPKHEAVGAEEFDVTSRKRYLVEGTNVLAIQAHNGSLDSSDLTIDPELVMRTALPVDPIPVIDGIEGLKQLVHVRGVYSEKQLQAVLAEFWENHFTTDYDKVAAYLDELQDSDASDSMSEAQANREAAQMEYTEYEFFYDNALGNIGDLLLYSATSPTMLIYLDNVLNYKEEPNENYAREILELFAFGVDNHYDQIDIEELAKAFTGWFVCKVAPDDVQSFPASALEPPSDCGVQFEDSEVIGLGSGWKYFRGRSEPTPGENGEATTAWTLPEFDHSSWRSGRTGIGYGDGDDATTLSDMRNNYLTVYLRRPFDVPDPDALENLILEVAYDDGFVAYLNGTEVARSESLQEEGNPPAYDTDADGHEVDEGIELFNLSRFRSLLVPGTNVLAIQVHNTSLGSSDLSMLPRVIDREILPGSVENGDPSGTWAFRFDPDAHHLGRKTLFRGTPYRIDIPAGRSGPAGARDALDVIQAMVDHPAMAEFICIKLIQKFVSDEISLAKFEAGDVPPDLVELLAEAIGAWNSTAPRGNIKTIMRAILDPEGQLSLFWSPEVMRAKVKTPIEYINSTIRALNGTANGNELPELAETMGMHLFTRDDPDGWSEVGFDWVATNTMLERIEFSRALANNGDSDFTWNRRDFLASRDLESAEEIIDYFNDLLFQRTLPEANRQQLIEYAETDDNYNPRPLDSSRSDYDRRVRQLIGLMLSLPQWHFQ